MPSLHLILFFLQAVDAASKSINTPSYPIILPDLNIILLYNLNSILYDYSNFNNYIISLYVSLE